MELASGFDDASSSGLGLNTVPNMGASMSAPINSSNIGFQLLKKHGWKEGTGLGISEQGRLEPVQAYINNDKRGLGSHKPKKEKEKLRNLKNPDGKSEKLPKKKAKGISKKMKKMQEFEKRLQEKEFDRTFFREFWPDNV
ncbi:G patch domain-containing protein 11 [Olea europaea var. sylvestris]|uniref:G patch domain and ankyrin repeat-containing 1 homolog n=1 Tax=Olea europaea subsp. europaea TaxID=158383 RepID=A0A8S0Q873_OLEEU|nr:G patch domain-containing protein 11 [Olea europaea var. sylvestris]CAA2963435.1 G patch domain and ankyrin repeat-containing 1 homolog [Olea europaea subsp. europaea]